ncbi:triosephosphate isomerase [Candidatus Microgenomates bacterium]|nr:triosephosphate isomerase [Candidatus Microgenomates bacterium]
MEEKFLIVANIKLNNLPLFDFPAPDNIEIAIAPQFTEINQVPAYYSRAAQNVDANARKLKGLGVKYCLVGHSYYRNNFGETNEIVAKKIMELESVGITPIVCARSLYEVVTAKIIMYEPEEAISTNGQYHAQSPQAINAILEKFPNNSKLLYGGSVNPSNCKLIKDNCKMVSGFVVGHASLDPKTFLEIVTACS